MADLGNNILVPPERSFSGTGTTGDLQGALTAVKKQEISAFRVCRGCVHCKEAWFDPVPVMVCMGGRNPRENDPARIIARVLNEFRCPKGKTMRDVQD